MATETSRTGLSFTYMENVLNFKLLEARLIVLHCVIFCGQRRLKVKPKTLLYNAVFALPGTSLILSDALFFRRKIYQSK